MGNELEAKGNIKWTLIGFLGFTGASGSLLDITFGHQRAPLQRFRLRGFYPCWVDAVTRLMRSNSISKQLLHFEGRVLCMCQISCATYELTPKDPRSTES